MQWPPRVTATSPPDCSSSSPLQNKGNQGPGRRAAGHAKPLAGSKSVGLLARPCGSRGGGGGGANRRTGCQAEQTAQGIADRLPGRTDSAGNRRSCLGSLTSQQRGKCVPGTDLPYFTCCHTGTEAGHRILTPDTPVLARTLQITILFF